MSQKPERFLQSFPTRIIEDGVFSANGMIFSMPLYQGPRIPSQGHPYTLLEPQLQKLHCGQGCQIQQINMQNSHLSLNFRYTTNNRSVQICLMNCMGHSYIKICCLHKIQINSVLSMFSGNPSFGAIITVKSSPLLAHFYLTLHSLGRLN